jgi:hypothetical protein
VPDPLALTPAQAFELERMTRAIDAVDDVPTLQGMCKQLLEAWMTQRAATTWVMRQGLPGPPHPPASR